MTRDCLPFLLNYLPVCGIPPQTSLESKTIRVSVGVKEKS